MNVKGENKFAANKTEHKDQTKNIIEIQTCKVDLNDVLCAIETKKMPCPYFVAGLQRVPVHSHYIDV